MTRRIFLSLIFFFCGVPVCWAQTKLLTELPAPKSLWTESPKHQIKYADGEKTRSPKASAASPSGSNRVFTDISEPTYAIHRPEPSKSNGVGLVICPGGGYTDVWLDREGHDLAIWLKQYGVTSLVLKYRTNGRGEENGRKYAWDDYLPAVIADARQAVRTLRSQAKELKIDPDKIGISGFSAGGNLALQVAVLSKAAANEDVSSNVNFAGLFYPWFRTDAYKSVELSDAPPMFIMNAVDDRVTPANRCIEFYGRLLEVKAQPELHIVRQGGHGFDLGEGKGKSTPLWKNSFVAWLHDAGFADE